VQSRQQPAPALSPVPFSAIQAQARADRETGTQRISLRIVRLAVSRARKHALMSYAVADPAHWPAPDYGGQWIHGRLQICQATPE
jgi:hypothetical protein